MSKCREPDRKHGPLDDYFRGPRPTAKSPKFSCSNSSTLRCVALLHAHRDQQPQIDVVLHEFIGLNDLRRTIFGSRRQ